MIRINLAPVKVVRASYALQPEIIVSKLLVLVSGAFLVAGLVVYANWRLAYVEHAAMLFLLGVIAGLVSEILRLRFLLSIRYRKLI